jgi:hypothetical protein
MTTSPYEPQYDYGDAWAPPTPPPPSTSHRGRLIGASAAVVILAAGGVASYVAFSSADAAGGAASPQAAVERVVTDLNNSDLAGFLDDLAPGERDAISAPFNDAVHKLQGSKVLRPDTDLTKLNGIDVSATGFTYADQTIAINDHVQIVQLTGGTLHVSADASQLPFTSDFLHAVAPHGMPADSKVAKTVDIGAEVKRTGEPIRIAAEKVDGGWYPSLFYTVADNATTAAHLTAPSPADRIPDAGAGSADDAVRQLIQDLAGGHLQQALGLFSPDELGVIHDYGQLIVDRAHLPAAPVNIKDIQFTDTPVSGGVRVDVKSVSVAGPMGMTMTMAIDGSCFTMTAGPHTQRFCTGQLAALLSRGLAGVGRALTDRQRTALTDLFSGLTQLGIDTSQVDGKWYVNPVRSVLGLAGALLSGLKGNDLLVLARLSEHP